jgi:parallel beta-helix repeat protein
MTKTRDLADLGGGFIQAGTGAVQRTVKSKLQDVVSVKDFGAVGNGVTDDTEEIQAAIDAVSAAPLGGILHFPDGTYLVGTLTVGPSVTLLGAGATLKAKTGSNSIIRITGNKDITISGFIFDALNLTLAGLPAQDAGSGACCIYSRTGVDPANVTISGNRFINIPMPATAIQGYHAVLLNGANCTVDNNYVDQSDGDALNFNGGVAFVSNNHVRNSTDGGIAFNNGARGVINSNYLFKCNLGVGAGPEGSTTDPQLYHSILVTNNVFDSCEWGVNFGWFAYAGRTAPTNFTVDSNVFQNCKTHGFRYDGHTANFDANGVISNNVFYRGGSNAYNGTASTDSTDITLINCAGTVISGNTISENIASSTRRAIVIQGCSRIDVTGNAINSITLGYNSGIKVTDAVYGNLSGNNIRNTGVGIEIDGSGGGNRIHVEGNAIADFSSKGILIVNTTVGTTITNNRLFTGASVIGIDISPASSYLTCDFNVVETAGTNAIVLNTSTTANNYSISYNRAFTKGVIDDGPAGATKNVTGNW